jgi:hypothetical protein
MTIGHLIEIHQKKFGISFSFDYKTFLHAKHLKQSVQISMHRIRYINEHNGRCDEAPSFCNPPCGTMFSIHAVIICE